MRKDTGVVFFPFFKFIENMERKIESNRISIEPLNYVVFTSSINCPVRKLLVHV